MAIFKVRRKINTFRHIADTEELDPSFSSLTADGSE